MTLTVVTGMTDAIGFTRLGGVFTSVMTGNLVLLGIAGANHDGAIALHTLVAFAGYVAGTFVGARVAGTAADGEPATWPRTLSVALSLELLVFATSTIIWESAGAKPSGSTALALLGVNATALGIQSAAILRLGVSGLSTTYLTGTLTNVVAHLTSRRSIRGAELPSVILCGLVAGAAIGAATALNVPIVAPLIELALLGTVIVLGHFLLVEDRTDVTTRTDIETANH